MAASNSIINIGISNLNPNTINLNIKLNINKHTPLAKDIENPKIPIINDSASMNNINLNINDNIRISLQLNNFIFVFL